MPPVHPLPGRGATTWVPLAGGRLRRWVGALRLCLSRDVDLNSLHDPETIPAGLLARRLRGTPVVFDLPPVQGLDLTEHELQILAALAEDPAGY